MSVRRRVWYLECYTWDDPELYGSAGEAQKALQEATREQWARYMGDEPCPEGVDTARELMEDADIHAVYLSYQDVRFPK